MARLGWLGLLGNKDAEPVTGLVLSGGGSRGSFQLGALAYLYRELQIAPRVIVGTSAGSILASAIAQHADPAEQSDAVDTLSDLWFGLREQSDMFIERPWFAKLREQAPEWVAMLSPRVAEPPAAPRGWLPTFVRRDPVPTVPEQELEVAPNDPIALALGDETDITSSLDWTPGQLMQLLSQVGKIGRAGTDLNSIWQGADRTRSCYRPGPLLARLLQPEVFSPDRVATSGVRLRIAMVALESGELRFMREDGVLVDRNDTPLSPEKHNLAVGVLASCSIPAVFVPVELGGETYIDGGTRESLPGEMAIGHLGTSPTYMVVASPSGVPAAESMAQADIISITMRATSILMDESLRDEVAYARSAGAIVIEPELDVHDTMSVDPGLIRINWDYGWIRAAEATGAVTTAEEVRNRTIIALRMRAHALEQRFIAGIDTKQDLLDLVRLKYRLRDEVAQAAPGVLPPGAEGWWERFEGHPQQHHLEAPWLE